MPWLYVSASTGTQIAPDSANTGSYGGVSASTYTYRNQSAGTGLYAASSVSAGLHFDTLGVIGDQDWPDFAFRASVHNPVIANTVTPVAIVTRAENP